MENAARAAFLAAQVRQAQIGNEQALAWLIDRQMPQIRTLAARAVRPGMEYDDAVQEGVIGLYSALCTFDAEKGASFATYACICVQNAMASAVRASQRRKHVPLNSAAPYGEEQEFVPGPEEQLLQSEQIASTLHSIDTRLSRREKQVLLLAVQGCSYAQIARRLGIKEKAVDNALQRVRLKLKQEACPVHTP